MTYEKKYWTKGTNQLLFQWRERNQVVPRRQVCLPMSCYPEYGRTNLLVIAFVLTCLMSFDSRAKELHDDAFIFDAHVHWVGRQFYRGGDIGSLQVDGQVDLPRAKMGGINAMFFTLFVKEGYYPARFETKQTLRLIDEGLSQIERNSDSIELALNVSDIDRIVASGKIAAILALEGGFDLDGDLGVLRTLHRLGLRSVQLTAHNWANSFADSCCSPPQWGGLTEHGFAVIRELNRLGMVIDVSHASDETMEQAIEASSVPVIATHHGFRYFNNIPRLMSDDLLKKLAASGGIVALHIGNEFHNRRMFEWTLEQTAGKNFWDVSDVAQSVRGLTIEQLDELEVPGEPSVGWNNVPDDLIMSVDDWINVIDYAITLVGDDYVAIGSDMDGGPTPPRGIEDISDFGLITDAMERRGYSEERIRKLLGGNLKRVFGEITSPNRPMNQKAPQ